ALTFTASVSSPSGTPTGTVTFNDGAAVLETASLSNGKAAFVTSTLSVGTHSMTAVYTGNSAFATSTSPTLAQVVKDAPPPPPVIHTLSGSGWHLISSPYIISQTFASLPATAFAYNASTQSYIVTPAPPADTFHFGQGYWVYLRTTSLDIPGPGSPADTTQPFPVTLGQGWNLVGNPFIYPVTLSTITVKDRTGAMAPYTTALANHLVSNLFVYNSATQSYQLLGSATNILNPWDGAWIYSQQAGTTLVFNLPLPR
ncbi:MAG: Ig-like domain-containing protein, partial [Chloroflexi bacterium]|nr:Ig-like domain-containing protein [Chloroflexota bacterium]